MGRNGTEKRGSVLLYTAEFDFDDYDQEYLAEFYISRLFDEWQHCMRNRNEAEPQMDADRFPQEIEFIPRTQTALWSLYACTKGSVTVNPAFSPPWKMKGVSRWTSS